MTTTPTLSTTWQLTIDCSAARPLAEFWAAALGYEPAPPPEGFASWEEWLTAYDVPESEWDDGANLRDPTGRGPMLCFLKVPEPKSVKNRLHIDLKVSGGRHLPPEERWPVVEAEVERLTGLGATVVEICSLGGRRDHAILADPEGNEFCVV